MNEGVLEDIKENEVDITDKEEPRRTMVEVVSDDQVELQTCTSQQTDDQKIIENQSVPAIKFTITEEGSEVDESPTRNDLEFFDAFSVKLLQGTVTELERALRDSRGLITTRDDEIAELRKEVEKSREQVHKEQIKWQRKSALIEQRNREIHDLRKKMAELKKSNEELHERIKEFESPFSKSDGVSSCCSAMQELTEVKLELAERDILLDELRKNNCPLQGDALTKWGTGPSVQATADEFDRHNQLKLKFLRDAFFYFMIDFHSDEQMKAILAVLAYGDQREDVIMQAFRMRQRGKKFTVKEVSSRGLSFLHEEV